MTKRLLLVVGLMLALGAVVSAESPIPPCDPHCPPLQSGR